jgi:hypothetical protein
VDGGVSINIIAHAVCARMQIFKVDLLLTRPFHDALSRQSQPLGSVDHTVTFGTKDNFHTETMTFDMAVINLPSNAIIGRSMIFKFMAILHYTYLAIKVFGPKGVILVKGERKNALAFTEIILALKAFPKVEVGLGPCDTPSVKTGQSLGSYRRILDKARIHKCTHIQAEFK